MIDIVCIFCLSKDVCKCEYCEGCSIEIAGCVCDMIHPDPLEKLDGIVFEIKFEDIGEK